MAGVSSLSSPSPPTFWDRYEGTHGAKIRATPEFGAMQDLARFLDEGGTTRAAGNPAVLLPVPQDSGYVNEMAEHDVRTSLDVAVATFLLHVHGRVASLCGVGYYTIGPCGEELLGGAGMALKPQDSTALHYRHGALSLARQLRERSSGNGNCKKEDANDVMRDLLLGRARAYTVSRHDPVSGGVHCMIGGGRNEYPVTSTLSSQCPAAVGRALGYALSNPREGDHPDGGDKDNSNGSSSSRAVSFVTIGDGSLHNHHFLSSLTLARHARHLHVKCPVVFGISDNGLSISYETKNYVDTVFPPSSSLRGDDPLLPVFRANGNDLLSVYDQTKQAVDYARTHQAPCVILYRDLVRRFGHASTDRQDAYLDTGQIRAMADSCNLEGAMRQAVEVLGVTTYPELRDRFEELRHETNDAFGRAVLEPKVTLEDMMDRVSVPLSPPPPPPCGPPPNGGSDGTEKPQVMRKHMTRVLEEALEADPSVVYLGEDVRHGGYYLVTDGLAKKFPRRVVDFPPDETTLLGAALGFSQLGLTPIVEIPYAKYLDCGVDMFYEIALQHWLRAPPPEGRDAAAAADGAATDRQPPPRRGMIVRLQGFDRGVFGGNFHTHNSLAHIPPGVGVVCFSNGRDYVRGFRHALWEAKHGRIVMLVDCTHLLNLRHVHGKDRAWETEYPTDPSEMMPFEEVRRYRGADVSGGPMPNDGEAPAARLAIVSYGNGVVASLQARRGLTDQGIIGREDEVDVIDCPYLSDVGSGLENALKDYDQVLFADICKEGPGSNVFSSMITTLHQRGSLPKSWAFVGAPRTYNPLGSTVTFLNQDTIETAVAKLLMSSPR